MKPKVKTPDVPLSEFFGNFDSVYLLKRALPAIESSLAKLGFFGDKRAARSSKSAKNISHLPGRKL